MSGKISISTRSEYWIPIDSSAANIRFVPVKSAEQQTAVVQRVRSELVQSCADEPEHGHPNLKSTCAFSMTLVPTLAIRLADGATQPCLRAGRTRRRKTQHFGILIERAPLEDQARHWIERVAFEHEQVAAPRAASEIQHRLDSWIGEPACGQLHFILREKSEVLTAAGEARFDVRIIALRVFREVRHPRTPSVPESPGAVVSRITYWGLRLRLASFDNKTPRCAGTRLTQPGHTLQLAESFEWLLPEKPSPTNRHGRLNSSSRGVGHPNEYKNTLYAGCIANGIKDKLSALLPRPAGI